MQPHEDPRCRGWGQLKWGPFLSGLDRLSEAERLKRNPDLKIKMWALRILGGVELVPGVNIPVAAADRCWLKGRCLVGSDPVPVHVLHSTILCCLPLVDMYAEYKNKEKEKAD